MAKPASESKVAKPETTSVKINGKTYDLFFSWDAYGEMREKYGENPDYLNSIVLADALSYALRERNPEVTAEEIKKARPPMVPAIRALQRAIRDIYYGDESAETDAS